MRGQAEEWRGWGDCSNLNLTWTDLQRAAGQKQDFLVFENFLQIENQKQNFPTGKY